MRLKILSILLLFSSLAGAQTTQPASALEARANQAFAGGEFAIALPLFEKLIEGQPPTSDRVARIREQIQVCTANLQATQEQADRNLPLAARPAADARTTEARKPHTPPAEGEVLELTIQELGNFEYDDVAGGGIPEDVIRLTGSTVRLRGFMIPIDQADNIRQFSLVPDLLACCFGAPPQIQHMVIVSCPPGKSVKYFPDEITVEGVLKVEEKKEDDYILSLFELTAGSVKPSVR